jgi:hypothetical protein
MAITAEKVQILIDAKVDSALQKLGLIEKKVKQQQSFFKKMGKQMQKAFAGAVSVAGIGMAVKQVAELGMSAIKAASDMEETQNKFNVVFANVGRSAEKASREIAQGYGLSNKAAKDLLSNTGNMLTGFGFTEDAALDMSSAITKTASDLVSFTNYSGGAEGASDAITKALLGEREMLKGLGIAISEADISKLADEKGIKNIDRQTKAMLTYELIIQRSKNATGDFARSQGSLANQTRILQANIDNFTVAVGQRMAPALAKAAQGLNAMFSAMNVLDSAKNTVYEASAALNAWGESINKSGMVTGEMNERVLNANDALKEQIKMMQQAGYASGPLYENLVKQQAALQKLIDTNYRFKAALSDRRMAEGASAKQSEKDAALLKKQADNEAYLAQQKEQATRQATEAAEELAFANDMMALSAERDAEAKQKQIDEIEKLKQSYVEASDIMLGFADQIGGAIAASFQGTEDAWKTWAKIGTGAVAMVIESFAKQWAALGVGMLVPGPTFNPPAAAGYFAAAAGAQVAAGAIKGMAFKEGGQFTTNGPMPIIVGDNPGGRERVTVEPIGRPNSMALRGGVTNIYIKGSVVEERKIARIARRYSNNGAY